MRHSNLRRLALSNLVLFLAACSSQGGGGGSGSTTSNFELIAINLDQAAVWHINRPIEMTFNEDVEFGSVSLNTVSVQTLGGKPATGTFFQKGVDMDGDGFEESIDLRTIVFQPTCPTLADFSDSGLAPGGVAYVLTVVGKSSGTSNTVRSVAGAVLETAQSRSFTTPTSTDPTDVFLDLVGGPPTPIVRELGSTQTMATRIETGDGLGETVYFEFDPASQTYSTDPPGFEVPLNLYSDSASHVAVLIEFNQAVSPLAENISEERVRIEYVDSTGIFVPIDTRVVLETNCTRNGSTVRLEPIGILPASSFFRVVVLPGFQDLVGDSNLLALSEFATAPTRLVTFGSLFPPDDLSDEFLEEFAVGGTDTASFEDTEALFETPKATWEDGSLTSGFAFAGTGGPNGDFDWVVTTDSTFDTSADQIVGGPGGIPQSVQNSSGGIVDVRDFIIAEGVTLRIQGPNPFVVNASRDVIIRGTLDVGGFAAKNVATLNTGNQVEKGGIGVAGGGDGGNGNIVTTNSSPCGGIGEGSFGVVAGGGQGGETGYSDKQLGKDARRPGGGGGGRFAADQTQDTTQQGTIKHIAESGTNGHASSRGAKTGLQPALGGSPGSGPFSDGDSGNDFFGVRPIVSGSTLIDLLLGELPKIWAGAGGGGGGNADPATVFPTPNWGFSSDEKGGPGGGGAGGVNLRALGRIIFGFNGTLVCNGGLGGTGENTIFLDHIGGSGGSGSGGHVVLESASYVDFTDGDPFSVPSDRFFIVAMGGARVLGEDLGNTTTDNANEKLSNGGAGGSGVIQIHVPDPITKPTTSPTTSDIVVGILAALSSKPAGPLTEVVSPLGLAMIPTFAARSKSRSKWISIGGADQSVGGGANPLTFLFRGTETADGTESGKILTSSGFVDELPALLGPEPLTGSSTAVIQPDEVTLRISGASLSALINDPGIPSNDLYLRTPALLKNFVLRLGQIGDPSFDEDFTVANASYDDTTVELDLVVDGDAQGTLQEYVDAQGVPVQFTLIPRFFGVVRDGIEGALPDGAFVRITFQATGADSFGEPDEANILIDSTGDISDLNGVTPGTLKFFRFEVEFDLDALGAGLSVDTKPIALDFLRIPFRF
jgi:hypothetical protein